MIHASKNAEKRKTIIVDQSFGFAVGCNNSIMVGLTMRFDVMPVATEKQIVEVEQAANHVWHNYYKDIFSPEQIEYMKSWEE